MSAARDLMVGLSLGAQLTAACARKPPVFAEIQRLVEADTDGTAIRTTDHRGWLPLHFAIHSETSLEIVRYLYCAASWIKPRELAVVTYVMKQWPEAATVRDLQGLLPVDGLRFLSARLQRRPNSEWRRQLTESMVSLMDPQYPLHFACEHGVSLEIVKWLVEEAKLSLDSRNAAGEIPLQVALQCRHLQQDRQYKWVETVVLYMLQRQPELIHVRDGKNRCLLQIALTNDQLPFSVVQLLLKLKPSLIQSLDEKGLHPVCTAASHNAPLEVVFALLRKWPTAVRDHGLPLSDRPVAGRRTEEA